MGLNVMNIRDIADKCGVSVSTVSRIINNKPDVKPETREQVINVMNEAGFRPSFKIVRNDTIGIVMQRKHDVPDFTGELIIGISETAFSLKKTITIISPDDDGLRNPDNVAQYCRINGLCGMMVIAPWLDSGLPQALAINRIPHVIIAASYPDTDISWVDVDNMNGSSTAVKHLIENGHRRIAMIHTPVLSILDVDRIQGYRNALQDSGILYDEKLIFEITNHSMDLANSLKWMMDQEQRPTGIFCSTYPITLHVLNALQGLGYRIPEDVSLIGFGDYDVSPLLTPPMTSVHQPVRDLGKTAMVVMGELLQQEHYSKQQRVLNTRLIIRKSTRQIIPERG
jgi:LacI family transcriptional regulator